LVSFILSAASNVPLFHPGDHGIHFSPFKTWVVISLLVRSTDAHDAHAIPGDPAAAAGAFLIVTSQTPPS
jgi:hypothetical protein